MCRRPARPGVAPRRSRTAVWVGECIASVGWSAEAPKARWERA
jgi:hypothetical protein